MVTAKKIKEKIDELEIRISNIEEELKNSMGGEPQEELNEETVFEIPPPPTNIPLPPNPVQIQPQIPKQDNDGEFRQIAIKLCKNCFKAVKISENCDCGAEKGYEGLFIQSN